MGLELQPVQPFYIQLDCFLYFGYADELVCSVASAAVTGTHLHGWPGHKRLVAEGRRTERNSAHLYGFGDQWVVRGNARRAQTERAGLHFAFDL